MSRLLLAVLVAAVSAPAFAAERQPDLARGNQVFQYWCSNCHGSGNGKPGTVALAAKYKGERPALLEQRTDLPADLTKFFVRQGVSIMPFFRKTEISDAELDDLGAYLARNTK